jgi:hypothetical protein
MKLSCFLGALVLMTTAFAVETKESGWLGTFAKKALNEKYAYWIETQVRYGFYKGKTNQVLYRTGLLQKISENQGMGYLYGHISGATSKEHRLTLQHVMNYGIFGDYKLSHRARLEARFLEDSTQDAGRFRYLFRVEENTTNTMGLVIWDEVFINTNERDWNGDNSFERNRLFIGFKKPFFTSNRFEIGYLNQYVPRSAENTSEHVVVLYMFF